MNCFCGRFLSLFAFFSLAVCFVANKDGTVVIEDLSVNSLNYQSLFHNGHDVGSFLKILNKDVVVSSCSFQTENLACVKSEDLSMFSFDSFCYAVHDVEMLKNSKALYIACTDSKILRLPFPYVDFDQEILFSGPYPNGIKTQTFALHQDTYDIFALDRGNGVLFYVKYNSVNDTYNEPIVAFSGLKDPFGIDIDYYTNDVYFSNKEDGTLWRVRASPTGSWHEDDCIKTLIYGISGQCSQDLGHLDTVHGVAFDESTRSIFLSSYHLQVIWQLVPKDGVTEPSSSSDFTRETVMGKTGVAGSDLTHFYVPLKLRLDNSTGALYVSERYNHRVCRLTPLSNHPYSSSPGYVMEVVAGNYGDRMDVDEVSLSVPNPLGFDFDPVSKTIFVVSTRLGVYRLLQVPVTAPSPYFLFGVCVEGYCV
eukprot:GCRY01003325.1.p1 GENE.GCRY01003325.1~~GCRY01003325.1.p1  ORF type:complete len:422 (+),score=34.55 GCRY01003325.1:46-1311(+)